MKRILILLLCVFMLTGAKCTKDGVGSNSNVFIDPSMKVRCPDLPKIDLATITLGELYTKYGSLQGEYIQCAIRNDCLIEATDKLEGGGKDVKVTCPALKKFEESASSSTDP